MPGYHPTPPISLIPTGQQSAEGRSVLYANQFAPEGRLCIIHHRFVIGTRLRISYIFQIAGRGTVLCRHFGGGGYAIGPGAVYGESRVAPRSRAARPRCFSRS